MNPENRLLKIVDSLSGTIVGIGIHNDKIVDKINNNDAILSFDLINHDEPIYDKEVRKKRKKFKKVYIKKLHKIYKKKSVDTMICNVNEVDRALRYFIRESIMLVKGKVYCYGTLEQYQLEDLVKRYKRYPVTVELIQKKDSFLLIVDVSKTKRKILLDKWYMIVDSFMTFVDILGDGLLN